MKFLPLLIILSLCTFSCIDSFETDKKENESFQKYMPGEIIVKGSLEAVKKHLTKKSFSIIKVDTLDPKDNVYRIRFSTPSNSNHEKLLTDLAKELSAKSNIEFAEPNQIIRINKMRTPKDTFVSRQWAIHNIGQDSPSGSQGEPGADIDVMKAWAKSKGSKEIIVGVIDTGIDYTHPDLVANMWINEKERDGIKGKDDDGNGWTDDVFGWNFDTRPFKQPYYGQLGYPDPMDDNSHGTHCAGVIGAKANNFKGIAGVNWNVRLMAIKYLDKNGSGSAWDSARAIKYGIVNKADILSASWGGEGQSSLTHHMIKKANEAGILFVAAAGNNGTNSDVKPYFPATYPVENIIAVAATDNKDQLANFSNYGIENVDIAAPGVDILSTIPLSLVKSSKFAYASFSGTSMAAPYVSGAAALLIAAVPELKGKPALIKKRLMDTVDVVPQMTGFVKSQGRLNVYRAIMGELNQMVENQVKTHSEPYLIESPRYNTELFDKTWTISKKGASRIRIHFSSIVAESPNVDLIAIYNSSFQRIFTVEKEYPIGTWSPWIEGDKIYLRMANALVAKTVMEEVEFKSPEDGFKAGATNCRSTEDNKTVCMVTKQSDPFANYESEGFTVDTMEYQTQEGGA